MYFDWQDAEIVSEAIETISPLKITLRCHPVAAIEFDCVGDMVMQFLADTIPSRSRWDNEGTAVIIDPCRDPVAMQAIVREQMENIRFSIFDVAMLDLADEGTDRRLTNALAERRERFVGEYPVIEF